MNIVVCIKQVPDVPSIHMDRERMTVIREGVESVINPLDYVALQAALNLRAQEGGSVTALTMGPPQSEAALREALAFGADKAVLLSDPLFAGADTLATSHVLARALSIMTPQADVVLCGMQTIDSDTGHVGPQIAEELDMPQVCGVTEIHVEKETLLVKRLNDGIVDTLRVMLPALLTVRSGLAVVGNLALGSLERAFSEADLVRWGSKELALNEDEVGLRGSATKVWALRPPPPRQNGEIVTGSPQELVRRLIRKLETLSIVDEDDGDSG